MNSHSIRRGIFSAAALFFLIIERDAALSGAQEGLLLCLMTVIPCMFPFFLFCSLLISSLRSPSSFLLRPVEKILQLPKSSGLLLVPALLGGYPAGAKAVSDCYHMGVMNRCQAQRMLCFCSNAGPAFLLGFLPSVFPDMSMVFCLWAIHIGSSLILALLLPPGEQTGDVHVPHQLDQISPMTSAIKATSLVCGWIICFRIFMKPLDSILIHFPAWMRILIRGLLELTSGCSFLTDLTSWRIQLILAAVMLGFGGLCTILQVSSIAKELSIKSYITGRVLHCLISLILALLFISGHLAVVPVIIIPVFLVCRKKEKRLEKPALL